MLENQEASPPWAGALLKSAMEPLLKNIPAALKNNIAAIKLPKNVTAGILVFIAAGLVMAAYPPKLNDAAMNRLKKFLPEAGDLATSPTAQKILKDAADKQNAGQTNADIETGESPAAPAGQNSKTVLGDKIAIPRLETELPLVTASTRNVDKLHEMLDFGVLLYPGSAAFGTDGQTVVLGHSAPANWPDIKFERAFSRINELNPGDAIIVSYLGKTYLYQVTRTQIIEKGKDFSGAPVAGNTLILVSCWPPGHDQKRIAVEASLGSGR